MFDGPNPILTEEQERQADREFLALVLFMLGGCAFVLLGVMLA